MTSRRIDIIYRNIVCLFLSGCEKDLSEQVNFKILELNVIVI